MDPKDQNQQTKAAKLTISENYAHSRRPRLSLSPEIVAGTLKVSDCSLVLMSAAVACALYNGIATYSAAELERYLLTSLVAGVAFTIAMRHIGAYGLEQLSMLHWQLRRGAAVWAQFPSSLCWHLSPNYHTRILAVGH